MYYILIILTKMWKQPKCPSIHEWISKLWYMYTMEYYSAIRNNDDTTSLWFSWRELEPIILSEVSQEWKNKHHMYSPENWFP
uniref:DUF1725 domain-containing protein n=1 Tax=Prolemur simus TaxID=1328070 RepID=A0A8C8ZBU6_PROSS